MSATQSVTTVTLPAGGDLSSDQFKFVVLASDGQIDVVASAGGDADGVLMDKPTAAGQASEVAVAGIAKVIAGAAGIVRGQKVQSDATGLAILAASGDHVLGKAVTTAASGELCEVLLVSKHILA